jgi:FkbM family methyltransferase
MIRPELYDVQTIEVMQRRLRPESNAADVGCHSGEILREILKLAPDGRHLAFEPLPGIFAMLEAQFGGNSHVSLFNIALSDAAGTVEFQHVVSNPAYSGLRKRRYDGPDTLVEKITVETAPLDALVPESMSLDFIKIDVEGGELQVLRGAVETIARCRPAIVFEHGLGAADYYGTTPEQVYDLLSDVGLRCFLMSDWLATDGKRSLGRQAFCDEFYLGRNYYFLAA